MGVTTRRLGFAILVALAILLGLRKPATDTRESMVLRRENRARDLSLRVANARLYWSALEQRDSALASPDGTRIGFSGFSAKQRLIGGDSTYLAGIVDKARRDSAVPISLHLYQADKYGSSWWGLYQGTLVPADDSVRCTAIFPASQRPNNQIIAGRHLLGTVLAPCLLQASFGTPGRTVSSWLQSLRYAPAMSSEWLTRMSEDQWDSGPRAWLYDASLDVTRSRRGATLSRILGLERVAELLSPPYYYGQIGLQCLAGIRSSCIRAVLDPGIIPSATRHLPSDLTIPPIRVRSADINLFTVRPPGGTFLSDLIQEKGPGRFSVFWKSEAPFEIAFEEAFQESLADWTMRWARRRWLMTWDARYRTADILLGVTLRPLWVPLVAGWSVIAVGAAGWAARRRQVPSQ